MASKEDLSGTEIDAKMDELDARIDKLRTAYEQYFIGVMKQQPQQQHKDVVRILHELEHKTFIRKTAQKFRLGSLVQKFTSYNTYWNRVLRQIEDGTYKRDLQKVQRREERRHKVEQEHQEALELDLDMMGEGGLDDLARELDQLDAAGMFDKPKAPAPQPVPQPAAGPSPEEIRAQKLRELQRKLGIPDADPIAPQHAPPAQPARPAPYAPGASPQPAPHQPAAPPAAQPAYGHQPHAIGQQVRGLPSAAFPQVPIQPLTGSFDAPKLDPEAERRNKLEEMKRRLEERSKRAHTIASASEITGAAPPAAAQPAASAQEGSEIQRLRKLREMKDRMEQRSSSPSTDRAIERPSAISRANPAVSRAASAASEDEGVMRVYRNLVEAKKRCNEPVQGLSYESVARSMQEQRDRLRQSHGADDVDFKVIIKNGRAFLKPEPK